MAADSQPVPVLVPKAWPEGRPGSLPVGHTAPTMTRVDDHTGAEDDFAVTEKAETP